MHAYNRSAVIAIELAHPDPGIRELFFEQFKELKSILHKALSEEWEWQPETHDENGKSISRILSSAHRRQRLQQK